MVLIPLRFLKAIRAYNFSLLELVTFLISAVFVRFPGRNFFLMKRNQEENPYVVAEEAKDAYWLYFNGIVANSTLVKKEVEVIESVLGLDKKLHYIHNETVLYHPHIFL